MMKKLILQEFEVRALVSVYNKEGISDFIKKIQDELDLEVIATGGTFQHLKKNGIKNFMLNSTYGSHYNTAINVFKNNN